uniref:Uncharacterized protein n=1 Tax=Anguilla anguilla TaxID=7936 RepID=A0A0E9UWU2_ANGAN
MQFLKIKCVLLLYLYNLL